SPPSRPPPGEDGAPDAVDSPRHAGRLSGCGQGARRRRGLRRSAEAGRWVLAYFRECSVREPSLRTGLAVTPQDPGRPTVPGGRPLPADAVPGRASPTVDRERGGPA